MRHSFPTRLSSELLRRQFPGGVAKERTRPPRARASVGKDVDHRQHERCCLARPGLGDGDQILVHQNSRDRLPLDRSGLRIAAVGNGTKQFVGKAYIGKAHGVSAYRAARLSARAWPLRSEEHTSELQTLKRSSYAVSCL